MTLISAFRLALFVLGAMVTMMMVSIVVVKATRTLRQRRAARRAAEVRPAVLAAIDDGGIAVELLRRRRSTVETIAIALLPKLRGEDREALAGLLVDTGIIGHAADGLSARSAARRQRSAELLGDAGHRPASSRLVALLHDRDADVRITAVRALGRIGASESVHEIFAALGDRRVPANTASMAVLRIGSAGSDGIVAATHSEHPVVRATAAELAGSLGLIGATTRIVEMLDDFEPTVRIGAVRALGRLSLPKTTARIVEHLAELYENGADDGDDEVVAIVVALGQIGDRSTIPILEASLRRHHRLSRAAGEALTTMGARRSVTSQRERIAPEDDAPRAVLVGTGSAGST